MSLAAPRRGLLATRTAWVLLALCAVALLAVGSVHGRPQPASQRIAYLESVIKCPNCDDLTIAQSSSTPATHLRQLVTTWVGEGRSDAWIEQQVVQHYGSQELLSPPASGLDALVWVLPLVAVLIAAGGLGWFLVSRRHPPAAAAVGAEDVALVQAALEAAFAGPPRSAGASDGARGAGHDGGSDGTAGRSR